MYFCQQQRQKEEQDQKRAQLDARHRHVLSIVADCLRLEQTEVEDAVLERNQVRTEASMGWQVSDSVNRFLFITSIIGVITFCEVYKKIITNAFVIFVHVYYFNKRHVKCR